MSPAILSASGVALAAFCIWLAIRIINRREPWTKRAVIALALLLAYPLSFGPVCWINSRTQVGDRLIWVVYRPIFAVMLQNGPRPLQQGLWWFADLGAPPDHYLAVWNGGFFWQIGPLFD